MASSAPLCDICNLQHISEPVVDWCSECDEGFCTNCSNHHRLAKSTRHHITTPRDDYQKLPAFVLDVLFCKEHDEKFTHVCKQHDTLCCITCILHNHKHCEEISKIVDVVHNVKSSHAFNEIEQSLTELAENIPKIVTNRRESLASLNNSKLKVEQKIKEFRVKLNNHLDKLQEDIMKELDEMESTENKKILEIIDDLAQKENAIKELQVNLTNMKKHASDLQVYLAMKRIQDHLSKTDSTIESIVNSGNLQHKVLMLELNSALENILSSSGKFGKIVVEEKCCNIHVVTTKKKNQHAQFIVPHRHRTIEGITLELQQTLEVNYLNIVGCSILPEGRIAFTSFLINTLILINADGTFNNTLTIPGTFDVIYVKYNHSLAVSSGNNGDKCITFVDINTNKVNKTIKLNSNCYGIAEKDNILFFCTEDSIMSMNLTDEAITKFKDCKVSRQSFIFTFENNLYHLSRDTNTVTCYGLSAEVKWQFKDENIFKRPLGISVDNQGNVYVVSPTPNVVVISPDGQKCRELLNAKDNMDSPWAIHYDKSKDNLLVANYAIKAFLYKVN